MKSKGNILVAPLNWGLGHASRCIPIIHQLLGLNFNVIIGSDGEALSLLKKEFPRLKNYKYPSYGISYPKNGKLFKIKLFTNSPKVINSIIQEKNLTHKLNKDYAFKAIISDNRFGVRHPSIPSIIISHQINVLSGSTSYISSFFNKYLLNKFDRCWVPDTKGSSNLSGKLGHSALKIPIDYIGSLSRLNKVTLPLSIDFLIVLSGPPPHRKILEEKLLDIFKNPDKRIVLISGNVKDKSQCNTISGIQVYNYVTSKKMEELINSSKLVICRSGYSSIMDLASLEKKAFFIPTPGQYEQQYLAKRMKALNMAPYCHQEQFTLECLNEVKNYNGLTQQTSFANIESLVRLFESE